MVHVVLSTGVEWGEKRAGSQTLRVAPFSLIPASLTTWVPLDTDQSQLVLEDEGEGRGEKGRTQMLSLGMVRGGEGNEEGTVCAICGHSFHGKLYSKGQLQTETGDRKQTNQQTMA